VELRSWQFWRRVDLTGNSVRVPWDLRHTWFGNTRTPEPRAGYFVVIEATDEVVLVQGDVCRKYRAMPRIRRRRTPFGPSRHDWSPRGREGGQSRTGWGRRESELTTTVSDSVVSDYVAALKQTDVTEPHTLRNPNALQTLEPLGADCAENGILL
jgi:hypothetical protein